QKRGLAAAGRPENDQHLAILDPDRDVLQDLDRAEILDHVADDDFTHDYFSVSTRPLTKSRCMKTTTSTGGISARIATAVMKCHSGSFSAETTMRWIAMTMVYMLSSVVIKSGQRYWF